MQEQSEQIDGSESLNVANDKVFGQLYTFHQKL